MSFLESGGLLEDPAQPPRGNRGLNARQVDDAITARLATYLTQSGVQRLVDQKVNISDYDIQVATLQSRDTENRNNLTAAVARIRTAEGSIVTLQTDVDTAETEIDTAEANITKLQSDVSNLDTSKLAVDDFYIDPDKRYATIEDLSENWVFVFSHVPAKYSEATHVRVSWDGVIAYNNVWSPTTEYILFSIDPTQIPNLADNARTTPTKKIWRVQFSILKNTELLGIETVPIIIDRG